MAAGDTCENPSYNRYAQGQCRCPACREAHRVYYLKRRKFQAAVAQGSAPSTFVDAGPVRAKVRSLLAAGYTEREIARVAGIARNTVTALVNGNPATGEPLKKVRRTTKDAICSIRGRRHLTEGARVDASLMAGHVREWREALPATEIAAILGIGKTVVYDLLRGKERVSGKVFYAYVVHREAAWKAYRSRKAEIDKQARRDMCAQTDEAFEGRAATSMAVAPKDRG